MSEVNPIYLMIRSSCENELKAAIENATRWIREKSMDYGIERRHVGTLFQ